MPPNRQAQPCFTPKRRNSYSAAVARRRAMTRPRRYSPDMKRRSGGQIAAALGGNSEASGAWWGGRSMPSTVAAEGGAKLANICRFRPAFALFLRTAIFFDSNAQIDEKPDYGQETRNQSQRRIRLFQRRL